MKVRIPRIARLLEQLTSDDVVDAKPSFSNYTYLDVGDVSATPRHRKQVGRGCFRFVPDTYSEQREDWKEAVYSDTRPPWMRRAKERLDRRF